MGQVPSDYQDPRAREKLRRGVREKVRRLARRARQSEPVDRLIRNVRLMGDMVFDAEFGLAWSTKLTIFGALAYFLMPADTIPDIIPGLGLIDDAAVVGIVFNQVRRELTRYKVFRDIRDDDIVVHAQRVIEPGNSTDADPGPYSAGRQ